MKKMLKAVYQAVPFKKELFSILKVVYKPPPSVYQHLYFKGVFNVDLGASQCFKLQHYGYQLENEIFWEGISEGWEKNSIEIWKKLAAKSDVILDVGANTGIFSLIAKAVNPAAKVYAFEPVKRVFDRLVHNNRINGYDINCINKAASNQDGYADIYDSVEEHVYSASLNQMAGLIEVAAVSKVETITLDTFVRQHQLSTISLVKIDVEKFEPQVIEGFQVFLEKFKPALLIEILDEEIGDMVQSLTEQFGYLYFHIDEVNKVEKVSRMCGNANGRNYLICREESAKQLQLI